jgi:CBS domain-containing protein
VAVARNDGGGAATEEAGVQRVRDVMLARPKTLPADATVADLRRLFANPRVATAVLVEQDAFVGLVDRAAVDDRLSGDAPARPLAHSAGVTIAAEATVGEAMARFDEDGGTRLAVLDPDGSTLQGLLCLNTARTGFCF